MTNKQALTLMAIKQQLHDLNDWQLVEEKILSKTFKFKNFKEALAFTNQVGELAEEKHHHPEIMLTWGKVTVAITTHDVNGLTKKDFELAGLIDEI